MPESATDMRQNDQLLSPEVHELFRYRPHWAIRKGNSIFFLIIFFLLTLTWIIRYPDMIRCSMKVVAINAPKLLIAKTEGKLVRLLVSDGQRVGEGQCLAFLQSTAKHEEVLALRNWIAEIEPLISAQRLDILLSDTLPGFHELGELQSEYQDFQNTYKETLQILSDGYYQQKKKLLLKDIRYLSAIQTNTHAQERLIQQDYDLQEIEYEANESLAKEKVIAPLELNRDKSKVIGKEQALEQIAAQLVNNEMLSHNKKKEILDLQKFFEDQYQKFYSEFMNLKSKIALWMDQFVVVAPEQGKVLFTSFLQQNELLAAGQELFYIQPSKSRYYGQVKSSQEGFGKIRIGQKVLIEMDSYPAGEFGFLRGTVTYIADIPTAADSFLIKVDLPEELITNYKKRIYFRNDLVATAEIITDDRRLFQRFFSELYTATAK
jgi:multidrug resistance efflux pump